MKGQLVGGIIIMVLIIASVGVRGLIFITPYTLKDWCSKIKWVRLVPLACSVIALLVLVIMLFVDIGMI